MTFPKQTWEQKPPEDLGFNIQKLTTVKTWLQEIANDKSYQVAIARNGYLIAEWRQGVEAHQQQRQASAAKSFYSSLLGIAVAEGKLTSPDEKVVDHYPDMIDVSEDEGPKPGRYTFEKDRNITFRQLICNVSGYMKPGEEPGKVFHYQTYGMNILTHALATLYNLYDPTDPTNLPGCGKLLEDKIRNPIGASWDYHYSNFKLQPKAKLNTFGYYLQIQATAHDLLRAGHLWLNYGNWNGTQIIPESYLKEATITNPFILKNEPEENWKYGHGFWVNDHGKQWPDVPRNSFAASGAGAKHTWVCPSLGLVIVQNPGLWDQFKEDKEKAGSQNEILSRIVNALSA
ncbi:MAG: serine hydrolase [bacterium]|nr:serine hydrolase [bacterium]